jgi:glycosyltransferase involved in cell wall biosynthesis
MTFLHERVIFGVLFVIGNVAMKHSLIICTRNRCFDLFRCLVSISSLAKKPDEITIVDSSEQSIFEESPIQTLLQTSSFAVIPLNLIRSKPGLTLQRNIGVQKSTGDIVHFIDDDTVLDEFYLASMADIFEKYPDFGGGMGTVTNIPVYKFSLNRLFRIIFLLPRDYASGKTTISGLPTFRYGLEEFNTIESTGGCCMSFQRDILLKYPFEEKFPRYGALEDVELSYRISRKYKLFYNPQAKLEHFQSPTARHTLKDHTKMYVIHYSHHFFKNVYPYSRYKIFFYGWSMIGILLNCIIWERSVNSLRGFFRGLLTSK